MRYRKVMINGDFLCMMLTEGNEIKHKCIKGLPAGSRFAYSFTDGYHAIWMVIEHESFDELKSGDIIPDYPGPLLERIA